MSDSADDLCPYDCRPGIISHFSVTIPETLQSMQHHWLTHYGSQLPDDVPHIMHVRHMDDYDAPTIPYPSCCVLMPGGFSYTPYKAGTYQQCLVLKRVAGERYLERASPVVSKVLLCSVCGGGLSPVQA